MRFKDFINEAGKPILDRLKSDCEFYFENVKGGGHLYRGNKGAPDDWTISTFTPRTAPRDSPQPLHDGMNEYFKHRFGTPFRNGLFTTGRRNDAYIYGPPTVIFPIGKFEWLCNVDSANFRDLTGTFDRIRSEIRDQAPNLSWDERTTLAVQHLIKLSDKSDGWRHNTNLDECIESESEIILWCHKFYSFNAMGETFRDVISKHA